MRRSMAVVAVFGCLLSGQAQAWSNHAYGSVLALRGMPGMLRAEVPVEPLEVFLTAQAEPLARLLDEQEAFAREHFADYPARPDALRWQADGAHDRQAFMQALRINPQTRLALFVQAVPGISVRGRTPLAPSEVTVYQQLSAWADWRFYALQAGERLAPVAILASAADEPDYGHDINLFADNPGTAGARYNFGEQPFGDARFEYSSQAPFHIGYYHENPLVFAAGPFLRHTYPHWRAYQYVGLARLAFAQGHPYWGYRFLGWALHYLQDLTQPYHAAVLPGASTGQLLWTGLKAMAGYPADKQAAIERVGTRHTEVEKFQLQWLKAELASDDTQRPLLRAYADTTRDTQYPAFTERYLRETVARESREQADEFDALIGAWLAAQPAPADFSQSNQLSRAPLAAEQALQAQILDLIGHFGAHTRNAVQAVSPR